MNLDKTEFLYLNQGSTSSLNGKFLKLLDQFIYLHINISSTEYSLLKQGQVNDQVEIR